MGTVNPVAGTEHGQELGGGVTGGEGSLVRGDSHDGEKARKQGSCEKGRAHADQSYFQTGLPEPGRP